MHPAARLFMLLLLACGICWSGVAQNANSGTPATGQEATAHANELPGEKQEKDTRQGSPAPVFAVTDLEGNRYSSARMRGKIIVLNFWFIECQPCVAEIPELNKLTEKYADQPVVFLGLALNSREELLAFLQNRTFAYHLVPDSRPVARDYNVMTYPTHVVIDQTGKITYTGIGLNPFTTANLDKEISRLLGKKP